jgi:hypothetical protein
MIQGKKYVKNLTAKARTSEKLLNGTDIVD